MCIVSRFSYKKSGTMGFGCFASIFLVLFFTFFADCALDFQCLKCLCETATQCVSLPCDPVKCSKVEVNNFECSCGPFGITPPFWMAANKPVLDDEGVTEAEKFKKCVETFPCSIWAVQYYMEKYAEDCDNDKLINCDDYVLIHTYGPNNCQNSSLSEERLDRYKTCMSRKEIIRAGSSGRTTKTTSTTTVVSTTDDVQGDQTSTDAVTEDDSSTIKPFDDKLDNLQDPEWTEDSY